MKEKLSGAVSDEVINAEFGYISDNYKRIKENVDNAMLKAGRGDKVRIMAVTKTVPPEKVNFAADCGITLLGENRVQEYVSKREFYRKDCEIHFIGGLQNNKVKYIIDSTDMIHSVDNIKLAAEIDKRACAANKTADVLIEINIGGESAKGGVSVSETIDFAGRLAEFRYLRLRGVMVIPPPAETGGSRIYFEKTNELFARIKKSAAASDEFDVLSMGMSFDYEDAVLCGSTIVRIGTALFGKR